MDHHSTSTSHQKHLLMLQVNVEGRMVIMEEEMIAEVMMESLGVMMEETAEEMMEASPLNQH